MGVTFFFFLQDCPTCPVQLKGTRSLQDKDLQFPEKDKVHIQISSHNSKDLVYLDWITFFRPVLIYILCQDRGERRTQGQLGQLKMLAVVNKTKFKCHLGGAFSEPREGLFCCEKDVSVWFKWGVMHSPLVFFRGSTLSRQKWSFNFSFQCSAQCWRCLSLLLSPLYLPLGNHVCQSRNLSHCRYRVVCVLWKLVRNC